MRLIFGRGARCDIYMKIRKKKKKRVDKDYRTADPQYLQ
jgi:hypothetical protein